MNTTVRDILQRRERNAATTMPRCRRDDVPLETNFPADCPLAARVPIEAVTQLRDTAWANLTDTAQLDHVRICTRCIYTHMGDEHVRQLRHALQREGN